MISSLTYFSIKWQWGVWICFYHVQTNFGSYLSQILEDFASIWVILKLTGVGPKRPKRPNAGGSGSDQNQDRKAREPIPDSANKFIRHNLIPQTNAWMNDILCKTWSFLGLFCTAEPDRQTDDVISCMLSISREGFITATLLLALLRVKTSQSAGVTWHFIRGIDRVNLHSVQWTWEKNRSAFTRNLR